MKARPAMTHLALAWERSRDSVESIGERLKALVESSLREYGCSIAYAEEITGEEFLTISSSLVRRRRIGHRVLEMLPCVSAGSMRQRPPGNGRRPETSDVLAGKAAGIP